MYFVSSSGKNIALYDAIKIYNDILLVTLFTKFLCYTTKTIQQGAKARVYPTAIISVKPLMYRKEERELTIHGTTTKDNNKYNDKTFAKGGHCWLCSLDKSLRFSNQAGTLWIRLKIERSTLLSSKQTNFFYARCTM